MAQAIELARSGELPEVDPDQAVVVEGLDADLQACQACRARRTKRGNFLAAPDHPQHQCESKITKGARCPRTRQPGSPFCSSHASSRRWSSLAPGRFN
jgi:hypothetical protein